MKNRFIFFFLVIVLLQACTEKPAYNHEPINQSNWAETAVAYEIFVQSFADANGDGIGDFNGMTSKLGCIEALGVDAIWLMPIMESPSYHKYDVTDYRSVHPDYGTIEDFKAFVKEAHARDIKVIVDFIINHTSSEHPWFLDAKSGPDAEYRDFYVWADRDSIAEEIAKKETSFDSDNITQWHAVDGDTTAEHYYGFFYGGMPDLNYDNQKVRDEIYDIGRFWLEEVGVDGFRMDAAKHIFPDDRSADNHAFWAEFKNEMEKVKPDVYIVGEVWADVQTQIPYIEGFNSLFNFDLAYNILKSVKSGEVNNVRVDGNELLKDASADTFIDKVVNNNAIYDSISSDYIDAIFLSNHDQNRVMSVLENDTDKAMLAASILFTLPGTPYIYYGEEIGMRGMKPDPNIREPFLWTDGADSLRATWIEPVYTTESTVEPLSGQQNNPNSMYNHYKKWIEIRKSNEALTLGELKPLKHQSQGILKYSRSTNDQELLIIHNLSDSIKVVEIPDYQNAIAGSESWFENGTVSIPQYQSVIIKL